MLDIEHEQFGLFLHHGQNTKPAALSGQSTRNGTGRIEDAREKYEALRQGPSFFLT